MDQLPAILLENPGSDLGQWLRVAGFPVSALVGAPPLLHPGGPELTRVGLPGKDPDASQRWILVSREDWQSALGQVFKELSIRLHHLRPLELCPCCGLRLEFQDRLDLPEIPEAFDLPASALARCPRCPTSDWPGTSHQDRMRQLREIFLEHAFCCVRCGETDGASRGRNLAKVEILCSLGQVEITEEDLAKDPSQEILEILAKLEATPEQDLQDSVSYCHEQALCHACRRQLVGLLRAFFQPVPPEKGTS